MAALLSSEMDGSERDKYFVEHIEDCRRMGIEGLAAERQRGGIGLPRRFWKARSTSAWRQSRESGSRLLTSMRSRARGSGGPFRRTRRPDFERVPLGDCQSGLHRGTDQGRARSIISGASEPVASRCLALVAAGRPGCAGRSQPRLSRGLFEMFASPEPAHGHGNGNGKAASALSSLPDVPELADVERLAEEKKVLGFYMSSHPLARHAGGPANPCDAPSRRPEGRR